MQVYDEANTLARAIRESDVCQDYRRLKEAVDSDETSRALVKEYKRLQLQLQMAAVSGAQTSDADVSRFQQISGLLFAQENVELYWHPDKYFAFKTMLEFWT